MTAWITFIVLSVLSVWVHLSFVPRSILRRYAHCPKPAAFWLAQIFSHGIWIVAAVQSWLAPTSFAAPIRIVGAVWMAAGSALQIWAMAVNPDFIPVLVKPARLVTAGPYAAMDHPGYIGFALAAVGVFLLLAQTWALIPLVCYLVLLAWRARVESRFLAS